jgi:hypothetical protein
VFGIVLLISRLAFLMDEKRDGANNQWSIDVPDSEQQTECRRTGLGCDQCIYWNRIVIFQRRIFFHTCSLPKHNRNPELVCIANLNHGCDNMVQRTGFWRRWRDVV